MTPIIYARVAAKNLGLNLDGDQEMELTRLFQVAMRHATELAEIRMDPELEKLREAIKRNPLNETAH